MRSTLLLLSCLFAIANAYVRLPFAALPVSSRASSCLQSAVTASDDQFAPAAVNWDWQQVAESVFDTDDRPIILFDGHCNLCNGGVNFALDHDPKGTWNCRRKFAVMVFERPFSLTHLPPTTFFVAHFRFVSLQSKVGQSLLIRSGRNPDDISSIVVCYPDGQAFVESDAVLKIAQGLNGPLPAFATLGFVVPPVIRDALYHVVAENRYRFGEAQYEQCRLDLDGEFDNRFVDDP